ncbi:MAG: hypothetical protein B7X56_00255, partial [Burkholderiales bacterium 34-67-9]
MQSSALATHLRHNAPTMPHSPPHSPPFTPPQSYTDAAAALAQVQALYQRAVAHLRQALHQYVRAGGASAPQRVRACYPFVRLHCQRAHGGPGAGAPSRLSYGFVAGP